MSAGASPIDFGAVGDGVTDDTAAVNLCLASARAVDFGGPSRVYLLSGPVPVSQRSVLTGRGASLRGGVVHLRAAASRVQGLAFAGTGLSIESAAVVAHCSFVGGSGVTATAHHSRVSHCVFDGCGISVTGADRTTLIGNRLVNTPGIVTGGANFAVCGNTIVCASPAPPGSRGIVVVSGRGGRIQDNVVFGFAGNSIDCRGFAGLTVTGNSTVGGVSGVFVGDTTSTSITISGNNLQGSASGVRVESATAGAVISGVIVKGNTITDPTVAGVVLNQSGTAQLTGITVADNDLHLGDLGSFGVQVVNATCSRIAGNRVYRPTVAGVRLEGTDLVQVSDNFSQDAGIAVHNGDRAFVRDNVVYGRAQHAVAITHDTADRRNGMTVSGTRWRALSPGRVIEDARGTQLYDNVDTNPDPTLVRIMPFGDSITSGDEVAGTAAYRTSLWQRLTAGGFKVDFVGSKAHGPSTLGDPDHEGHGGYTIAQVDEGVGL